MGPKCHHKCPCRRDTLRRRHTERRRQSPEQSDAAAMSGGALPAASSRGARSRCVCGAPEGRRRCWLLHVTLLVSRPLREYVSVLLNTRCYFVMAAAGNWHGSFGRAQECAFLSLTWAILMHLPPHLTYIDLEGGAVCALWPAASVRWHLASQVDIWVVVFNGTEKQWYFLQLSQSCNSGTFGLTVSLD